MSTISEAHQVASKLRVPVFQRETAPREKIDQLEEYMLLSAYFAGELHRERLEHHQRVADLQLEWDHLAGWEPFRRSKTETAVEDAKRQLRPDLYDAIADARWAIARLSEEIDRLERDATKVSRTYTFITGS